MAEELETPIQAESKEPEIQTMPSEFYGGLKKALPKLPIQAAAPRQPLVAEVRNAPSPANTAPPYAGTIGVTAVGKLGKKFSLKMIISISGGVFSLIISGISYYYIHQARVIKENTQGSLQPVAQQIEISPTAPASTPEIAATSSTASSAPTLQPLIGVIFPPKIYSQTVDTDNDGLTDVEEVLYGTDPEKPDSDGDGFIDGLEAVNLYNPLGFKPVRLIDSGRINGYSNPTFGYSVYYPNLWSAQSLDSTNENVLFSSGDGDYVEVIKVGNPLKLSLTDWYKGQSPGTQTTDLKPFMTKDKVEGVLSPDGLTAYVPFGTAIYAIIYNIGLKDQVSFFQTFMMMITSFRYPGAAEQPVGGLVPPLSSSSTTTIP